MTLRISPATAAKWLALALVPARAAACGATSTQPHGATLEEHERAARIEEQAAEDNAIQATTYIGLDQEAYIRNWSLAQRHRVHAEEHRAAADALRDSDDPRACDGVPQAVTTECPLAAYQVADYSETESGVRVVYAGADAALLRQHVRCHLAHASMAHRAHDGADRCPLIGVASTVDIAPDPLGAVLTIRSDDPDEVARLRGLYVETDGTPSTPSD